MKAFRAGLAVTFGLITLLAISKGDTSLAIVESVITGWFVFMALK